MSDQFGMPMVDCQPAHKVIAELRQQLAAKQAEVDALMLEYCPSEMSQEQLDNWAAHQRPAKEFT